MQRVNFTFLLLKFSVLLVSCTGCSSARQLYTVHAASDQNIIHTDGFENIQSKKLNTLSAVLESPEIEKNELIGVRMKVVNQSSNAFDFGPSFITAQLNGMPHKLVTEEEMAKTIKASQSKAMFLSLLSAGLSSFSYSTYESKGAIGSGFQSSTGMPTTTRGVAKGFSIPNFRNPQFHSGSRYQDQYLRLRACSLKLHTLSPQSEMEGLVYFAPVGNLMQGLDTAKLEVTANIDNENHKLSIEIKSPLKK